MNKFAIGCIVVVVVLLLIGISIFVWGKNTYNKMVGLDEAVKEKWSQVENVYQRRMDLIPNLVATVQGYAIHEQETLTAVTEARSKAGGTIQAGADILNNPEAFQQFQAAQNSLSGALSRLMVVVERYPELKANEGFLALQSQLEGTENRITVERQRFNETAREFNIAIKRFPAILIANMLGFSERPYFEAKQGAEEAPDVQELMNKAKGE